MSLPIKITQVHGGLSEATGSLSLSDDYLILQVHVTIIGLLKQKPTTIKVAPEAIHSVRYRRGMFGDRLLIRPWKPELLAAVPGKHEAEVELKVKKEYRSEAEELVEEIDYWLERSTPL